jgi:hypothetical protein
MYVIGDPNPRVHRMRMQEERKVCASAIQLKLKSRGVGYSDEMIRAQPIFTQVLCRHVHLLARIYMQ